MSDVALIGYGYWGPNLARNVNGHPAAHLAVCCDLDESRLAPVRGLYPQTRVTTRVEDIWTDPSIDAVIIATPAATHHALAREAMEAGKDVLVEKPLALNSRDAAELVDIASRRKRILMVGHTFLYNSCVLKIKDLIDGGRLGSLFYGYSTRVNLGRLQTDIGALWSIAPHDVSTFNFLLGSAPIEVSARGGAFLHSGIEDVAFLDMAYKGGFSAHVHVSWLDPGKVRRMTVVGDKKMVIFDDLDSEGKVRIYDKGIFKVGNAPIYGEFQYQLHSGDILIPRIDMSEPLRNEVTHFLECVQNRTAPLTDGKNGLEVVKVLEAAQESARQRGAPVRVA